MEIKAKEKAIEMMNSFTVSNIIIQGMRCGKKQLSDIIFENAKQNALKAVDFIIKSNPTSPVKEVYFELISDTIDECIEFWEEVKKEINLL